VELSYQAISCFDTQ